jgi:hypothetical protein
MDILTDDELANNINSSKIISKYNEEVDRESAYEILNKKLDAAREFDLKSPETQNRNYDPKPPTRKSTRQEKSTVEKVVNSPLSKQIGRTLVREITRGILGVLGVGGRRR